MKDYEEFKNLRKEKDENNPFCALYFLESGESFYLEPVFYTQLMGFKDHFVDKYPLIIDKMLELVKRNKKVVFTGNFENPLTEVDNYIYLEVTDVTDALQIYAEDKSRGSDYGDQPWTGLNSFIEIHITLKPKVKMKNSGAWLVKKKPAINVMIAGDNANLASIFCVNHGVK